MATKDKENTKGAPKYKDIKWMSRTRLRTNNLSQMYTRNKNDENENKGK